MWHAESAPQALTNVIEFSDLVQDRKNIQELCVTSISKPRLNWDTWRFRVRSVSLGVNQASEPRIPEIQLPCVDSLLRAVFGAVVNSHLVRG